MRLLYCLTRSDTVGGGHVHILDLARWMRERGAEVHVAVGGTGPFCERLSEHGLPWTSLPALGRPIRPHRDLAALGQLRRAFRRLRPGLISLHSAKAGLLGRLAGLGGNAAVVYTAHGWPFTPGVDPRAARRYRAAERLAAPLAERIIAVSAHDRRLALAAGVGSPERVVAVPNGIRPAPEAAEPGRGSPVRIACVARLDAQKDHATLLDALAGLPERDWTLELLGDGPLAGELAARAQRLGIAGRVAFRGLRDDVRERLAAAQLFALPSCWEGLPLSVLEAMSAGLPVLASDVGGTSEAVRDGETGYLLARGDVDGWRARLAALLDTPEQRARLGAAGRARYAAHFTLERMAEETAGVYAAALEARSGRAARWRGGEAGRAGGLLGAQRDGGAP